MEEAKINSEEFYSMIFSDKRNDLLIEALQKYLKPKRTSSVLPSIQIKPISSLVPAVSLYMRPSEILNNASSQEYKTEDFISLLDQWWNEQDIERRGAVSSNKLLDFLIKKDQAFNLLEARKWLTQKLVAKSEFIGIFTTAMLKLQLLEISKKVGSVSNSRMFVPVSQKLSSIRRNLLIQRISPTASFLNKSEGENVISGLAKFKDYKRALLSSRAHYK